MPDQTFEPTHRGPPSTPSSHGRESQQLTRSFHVHRDMPPGVLREELTAFTRERGQVEALFLRLMDIS